MLFLSSRRIGGRAGRRALGWLELRKLELISWRLPEDFHSDLSSRLVLGNARKGCTMTRFAIHKAEVSSRTHDSP